MRATILIVDDEVKVTENLKIELQKFLPHYKIITSNYGYNALNTIFCEKINVVVTDIAMPDMNGYELYSRIKEYDENIAVAMITGFGYDPNHVLVRSKQAGDVDIFYKPFKTEDLAKLIEDKLEERS